MSEVLISALIGAFVGGLGAGLLNWYSSARISAAQRRSQHLVDQLNKEYSLLAHRFHCAGDAEYGDNPHADTDEVNQVIAMQNAYRALIKENNQRILEVLGANYAWIDTDDIDAFTCFATDQTRLQTEWDENGKIRMPPKIYEQVGNTAVLRGEFTKLIADKFQAKLDELARLHR